MPAGSGTSSTVQDTSTQAAPATTVPSGSNLAPATTTTPAPTTGATAGNPLAGATFYGPNTGAAQAARTGGTSAEDAALLSDLAQVPTAIWLGAWSGDVAGTVRQAVTGAQASGAVPVLVAYNVPGRDCGGYSAGGEQTAAGYAQWIQGVANGIGTAKAVVIIEPDALAQLCGDPAERYRMLGAAVDVLEKNPGTLTYLDAGNPTWIDARTMAQRLQSAGVAHADGFALNVSNFETTASNVSYGQAVSAALGGAHFVIDTSRNGNGAGTDWCNPPGRAVGQRPTAATGLAEVDAFLWLKRVGESDGTCNGGPPAGEFWVQYALGLLRAAA
ncbi:endoglucanase [Modestobacter sp. DSM 44400]|nr:endoglucanase [Modestobacter sp. DSM 44400]